MEFFNRNRTPEIVEGIDKNERFKRAEMEAHIAQLSGWVPENSVAGIPGYGEEAEITPEDGVRMQQALFNLLVAETSKPDAPNRAINGTEIDQFFYPAKAFGIMTGIAALVSRHGQNEELQAALTDPNLHGQLWQAYSRTLEAMNPSDEALKSQDKLESTMAQVTRNDLRKTWFVLNAVAPVERAAA